ncbi:hypothetical protein L1049_014582 [Liquidambar formosana]|uniref:B box-type domain-containing protein n=1 Tax=Liquidambar formosana TaxID=63359 RepID=A0AAP0RXF0_LIQFO
MREVSHCLIDQINGVKPCVIAMHTQCDVCEKEEAIVFCSADEAALCDGCDRRVHHANKLAEKHMRHSLLHPSLKDSPRCDICQEKLAFLFCQEDRAILCRECDLSIHMANEHTQKHNSFHRNYPTPIPPSTEKTLPSTTVHDHQNSDVSSILTSSISEYLMETLPGWRVDDFLDPSHTSNGFCKFMDDDLDRSLSSFSSEDLAIWVPQVAPSSPHLPQYIPQTGLLNGNKETKEVNSIKVSRRRSDDCFTVPQISPPSLKKSRHVW